MGTSETPAASDPVWSFCGLVSPPRGARGCRRDTHLGRRVVIPIGYDGRGSRQEELQKGEAQQGQL